MKVLIVEEALRGLHGHWFQYIIDIVSGGQEDGHDIEVAVHRDACPEILQAFRCQPILTSTVFEQKPGVRGEKRGFRRVFAHNRALYRDLSSLFDAGHSYDVVIATTVRLDHLIAYLFLYLRYRGRAFKNLVLIFVESVGYYGSDYSRLRFSAKTFPLKLALILFRLVRDKRHVSFVTESEGLSRQYEKLSGVKFSLVPHVTVIPPLESYRAEAAGSLPPADKRLVLGTFGFTRFDKGLDILQEAIKVIQKRGDRMIGARFILQWTGDYRLPGGIPARKETLPETEADPAVQYIPAFSDSDQYFKRLAQTDIMVLPYRKSFYFDKLSRIAIEAATIGLPFVYPVETWLEPFAKHYGAGVPFRAEDPSSLADAIGKSVENYAELKACAMARRDAAREAFSARAFFNTIAGFLDETGRPAAVNSQR